jgi:xylan 1,4-beta-xylosidase
MHAVQAVFLVALCLSTRSGFSYSFPDCTTAPLKGNTVCDTTKDAVTRAAAIIGLFTPEELTANTVTQSPGVPRLGLPGYQWWSEALVYYFTQYGARYIH